MEVTRCPKRTSGKKEREIARKKKLDLERKKNEILRCNIYYVFISKQTNQNKKMKTIEVIYLGR